MTARGFSRSTVFGDQNDAWRLDRDADDVAALIDHLDTEPAAVFGNSSGAIVALQVLATHQTSVNRIIAHEPPVVTELPEAGSWIQFFTSVYDLWNRNGATEAMERFRERSFAKTDRELMARVPTNKYSAANSAYWFEHELRQYPAHVFDRDTLHRNLDKLVLAVGCESRGFPCFEATCALGRAIGREPVEMPGGHLGFIAHPNEFALALQSQV